MYQGQDELTIIQKDIQRAIAKPGAYWAMAIDLRRCTGCKACVVGCMAEQKSPPGINYRPVYEEEAGIYPKVSRRFTPRPCMQCDEPPCVDACPNKGEGKATWKETKGVGSGIVMINYHQCIGCGRCVTACPYKARALDRGDFYTKGTPKVQEYENGPAWEYARPISREKTHVPYGVARKCHFCYHRLKEGMVPMCVSTCICRANYFGDLNDSDSLIYKVLQKNKGKVLALVRAKGETKEKKIAFAALKSKTPAQITEMIGYPGHLPVFADTAKAKPRVFYILP